MPLKRSTFTNEDIFEILQSRNRRWPVYVGAGRFGTQEELCIIDRIIGSGAVHGESNVVEKTTLENEAKGCKYEVSNIYQDLKPVPTDEVVKTALQMVGQSKPYGSSCRDFAFGLKYERGNLDINIRNMASIPRELTIAALKGVQIRGSAVNLNSEIVGQVATKGVDLAGQGVMAMSGVLGAAAGKSLAAFGSMLSAGTQTLAPIVAAKVDATGYGAMLVTAAERMPPLAESLVARSTEAEEATANSVKQLGSYISSNSSEAGSAVATGLSWWLGSTPIAGAFSLVKYLTSGTEQARAKITTEQPEKPDADVQK